MADGSLYPLPGEFGHHATSVRECKFCPSDCFLRDCRNPSHASLANYDLQRERVMGELMGVRICIRTHIEHAGNPAAHDAWQLALQHIEPLRAAIERARKAGE